MPDSTRRTILTALGVGAAVPALGAPAAAAERPDGGGATAYWTTGEQYGIGTVRDHGAADPSRVWFTLTEGALAQIRFPRVDLLNVRTVDFLVADGDGYARRTHVVDRTDEDSLDRSVRATEDDALVFAHEATETAPGRDWTLTAEYVADPEGDAVLADVEFEAADGRAYEVYVVVDPALAHGARDDLARVRGTDRGPGNGRKAGEGTSRGRYLSARSLPLAGRDPVVVDEDGDPYEVALSVVADRGFAWTTVDVVGGDAISPLLTAGDASTRYDEAEGNVALAGRLGAGSAVSDVLALGFAEDADEDAARDAATAALGRDYRATRSAYVRSWRTYLDDLAVPGSVADDAALRAQFDAAAMALKAADSKAFPGAGLASLSVPWGEAVVADHPADYGYNFTWSRDLYQAFTAMEAAGDVESAVAAVEYLYEYQQDDDGFVPQNTWIDGRTRWGGEQMDNVSFPQVMAYQLRERHGIDFADVGYDYENVRRSADYVAANGPDTAQERWEEESGYSPSTIAAEIAGLVCAASLADGEGADVDALVYLALADHWRRNVEAWTATTTGTDDHETTPYYVRINDDRDPDDGASRSLANGGPTLDERDVIDAGFLELVRLGIVPWDDEVVRNSLAEVDETIAVETPHGPGFYRYNGDGYGEQGADDDYPEGAPWSLDDTGTGRLWPIFTGERGEYELLAGTDEGPFAPAALLETMAGFANEGRMIPEQVWDREESTDYGWTFGEGTGSATPLSWSMAQFVRLALSIDAGEPVETPGAVRERYVDSPLPDGPALDVSFPPSAVTERTVTVSGTTDAATVAVRTAAETVVPAIDGDGSFAAEVAVGDGETRITVAAGTDADDLSAMGTAVARSSVSYVDVGDLVVAYDDPVGDDHGPGDYVYPHDDAFVDGAFDLDAFAIHETDETYQFLATIAGDLTNPWGSDRGFSVQTLQVYVRDPAADGGDAWAREGVNATFEAPHHYRVIAEGFDRPRVEAADGSVVTDDVTVVAYPSADAIKVEVPKSALGRIADLAFVPLLLGQDGFAPGGIRPVVAEAGDFVFGGGRDDDANPNVLDLVTPAGVDQSEALAYAVDDPATIPYLTVE